MAYIELKKVSKTYKMGEVEIKACHDVSFQIEKGELVVILGPSGAGKTTVLNLLGGMDTITSGQIIVDSQDITKYTRKELIGYRRNSIGFVFQFYNLVGNLTAIENVELAVQICKNPFSPKTILERVGLKDRINNFPAELSGGEQQRVAIARAIAKNPKILLCDEPTGALDSKTGVKILSLLQQTAREMGMTTIIITHNSLIAEIADKVIKIKNGTVDEVIIQKDPKRVEELDW